MWPWDWDLDWKSIAVSLITLVVGGLVTALGLWIREARRKISFSAKDFYYGPDLNANTFMGRNYPSEDRIGLDFDLSLFSYKSVGTGLHNFQIEFCRQSYLGPIVEFLPDMSFVFRDWEKRDVSHNLNTVDLPSREFVTMQLSTSFGREHWAALKPCTLVRLRCETPEGRKRRFKVREIQFPEMPPEGIRGMKYCHVQVMPNTPLHKQVHVVDGQFVIAATRRQKLSSMGQIPPEEDFRYWTGSGWALKVTEARVYKNYQAARDEGEAMKIWNNVPPEWLNDERKT